MSLQNQGTTKYGYRMKPSLEYSMSAGLSLQRLVSLVCIDFRVTQVAAFMVVHFPKLPGAVRQCQTNVSVKSTVKQKQHHIMGNLPVQPGRRVQSGRNTPLSQHTQDERG